MSYAVSLSGMEKTGLTFLIVVRPYPCSDKVTEVLGALSESAAA